MSLFKFFHSTKTLEEDIQREKDCILRIKQAVSQKCGIDEFIDYDEFAVAFAGSKDNMELLLEICTQKCDDKKYLYASLDDEVSWQEWDFDNLDEFENNIIDHIANRVNRTIKIMKNTRPGKGPVSIVIDSMKNIYESNYLKDR